MNLYLFSGLGADERLFDNLPSIDGCTVIPVKWIPPTNCISLSDYAELIAGQTDFEAPFALGGVSMGAMIAQELAYRLNPEFLVVISSMVSEKEMPFLLRCGNVLPVEPILTRSFLVGLARVGDKFTIKSKEGRELFFDMLRNSRADLLTFGAKAILNWKAQDNKVPVIRIHGTNDRVFPPAKLSTPFHAVQRGNHFMIVERSEEIGGIMAREIGKIIGNRSAMKTAVNQ